jgi:lysophospholipase L1-like esterase
MPWLAQTLLLGCAMLLAVWVKAPAAALAGIGVLSIALLAPEMMPDRRRESLGAARLAAVWAGSVTAWVSVALSGFTCDLYYAAPAWLMAAAVWLTQRRVGDAAAKGWKAPVMAWLFCGALIWLGEAYFQNERGNFYGALLATLALLVLWRAWCRLGLVAAQAVNTLILLLVGLPAADLFIQSSARPPLRPETCRFYYSFNLAKGDPEAYGRWKDYYDEQFDRLGHDIFVPAPNSRLPFRLRPNSQGFLGSCPVSINSRGFRGREFPLDKGRAYRIVCLGESTTFGMTFQAGEKPWPEVLEEIIRERLKTRRAVEVINAGVPCYSLLGNLCRLPGDILPLKPDLIISYHGANGFHFIDSSVLPPMGPPAPVYRRRPLRLAAQAEHRWRMMLYRRRALRPEVVAVPPSAKPLDTQYAAAYRQLIQCARTNGIRLALANFAMAVNTTSPQAVLDFYRGGGTRAIDALARANLAHSLIVEQIAAQHPEVCLVDTHPHLDGEHEKFIDYIHLTQEGRRQLAENIFAGVRNMLIKDLEEP